MIIVHVAGGLGNQLQQYALYRKLKHMGAHVKLDISWYTDKENQKDAYAKRELELDYFDSLPYEACVPGEKKRMTGEDSILRKIQYKLFPAKDPRFIESAMYHPEILDFVKDSKDHYLEGYFACEKYYADILPELRRDIRFPKSLSFKGADSDVARKNRETAERMQKENSVSIHIRRGDYLDAVNQEMFGGICTEDYYRAAIAEIKKQVPDAHFYVFSDDQEYVKEHYKGSEYSYVDWNTGKDSFYDIYLMSCCRHNICANSTFSFWGARLNPGEDKIMIRPAKHKNSQVFDRARMEELWKGWTFIDENGRM